MLATIATLAISSVYAAPPPPVIGIPVISPMAPGPGDIVTVSVNVTDANPGVKNVTLYYTTDNWQTVNASVPMSYNATISDLATGQIPSLASGGQVAYYLVAFDGNDNKSVNNNNGSYFIYDVTGSPGIASVSTLVYIGILGAVAAGVSLLAYMMLKKPSTGSTASSRTSRVQD